MKAFNNKRKDVPPPFIHIYDDEDTVHTEEMLDIITKVPSWLLYWGSTMFFIVLIIVICLSSIIKYPDTVKAQLIVDSPNSPKPVVSKISGKLVKLLVTENEFIKKDQPLAYLESTANHSKVLDLLAKLKEMEMQVAGNGSVSLAFFKEADNLQFGELQSAYQTFFQEYLQYISSVNNGFLIKKKSYLLKDLNYLTKQQQQLNIEKKIEQRDFNLASDEYEMHRKLADEKVETSAELRQEESKYLSKKSPIIQTEGTIITGDNNYDIKKKEILELDNQVQEEKGKFVQAINSLISAIEDWKSKYILSASQSGKVSFVGIVQENQVLIPNQEVFYINPGNEAFFGEMTISQNNLGKVKKGQEVLIKLRSYPFEEFGMLRGKIAFVADVPYHDSIFVSKVIFNSNKSSDLKKTVHLKQGMVADAEIVTKDATILQRLSRSLIKTVDIK